MPIFNEFFICSSNNKNTDMRRKPARECHGIEQLIHSLPRPLQVH